MWIGEKPVKRHVFYVHGPIAVPLNLHEVPLLDPLYLLLPVEKGIVAVATPSQVPQVQVVLREHQVERVG